MPTVGIPVQLDFDKIPSDPGKVIFHALCDALVLSCIRTHGQSAAAAVEAEFGRRQQSLLLAALASGTLSEEMSLPERCARAQLFCDASCGRTANIAVLPDGAAWIWYPHGHWMSAGLAESSASVAALAPEFGEAWYRSRHVETVAKHGRGQVQFVLVKDVTNGDPFDAGYFIKRQPDGAGGVAFVRRTQDLPRLSGVQALSAASANNESGPEPWSVAALRMRILAEMLGIVGATSIVEHAWRIVLGAYWFWLPKATGQDLIETPIHAAKLVDGIMKLEGEAGVTTEGDTHCLLTRNVGRWLDEGVPLPVLGAVARAWSAILPNFAWNLRMIDVETSLEGTITTRFDLLGPCG